MFVVMGFNSFRPLGEECSNGGSEAPRQPGQRALGDGPLCFAGALGLVVGDHGRQGLLQLLGGPAAAFGGWGESGEERKGFPRSLAAAGPPWRVALTRWAARPPARWLPGWSRRPAPGPMGRGRRRELPGSLSLARWEPAPVPRRPARPPLLGRQRAGRSGPGRPGRRSVAPSRARHWCRVTAALALASARAVRPGSCGV